jgi:uncharacterized OB-fold protein
MEAETYLKPVPEPSLDTAPYWKGLRDHRLMLQRCGSCRKVRHYPRPVCDECYSMEVDWVEASGRGRIHSWTVTHHPFNPGFIGELPITLVTVDLDEGVRMNAQLRGTPAESLAIGTPVRIGFEAAKENLTLPVFVVDGKQ